MTSQPEDEAMLLTNAFESIHRERMESTVQRLDQRLAQEHWAVTRYLQYFAIELAVLRKNAARSRPRRKHEAVPGGSAPPAWKDLLAMLVPFAEKLSKVLSDRGLKVSWPELSNDQAARNLGGFIHGGTSKPYGDYPHLLICLFLVDQIVQNPNFSKYRPGIEKRIPDSDSNLSERLIKIIASELRFRYPTRPLSQPSDETPTTVASLLQSPQMQSFAEQKFKTSRFDELLTWFERHAGSDRRARFLCFRPRLTDPNDVIISFLVINGQIQDSNKGGNFLFRHFYGFSDRKSDIRETAGIVIPLDEGLYLVGGQENRPSQPKTLGQFPFRTLEVLALPWQLNNSPEAVVPTLFLSTNAREMHMVGRMAVTPTLLQQYQDVPAAKQGIGHIPFPHLRKFITELAKREQTVSKPTNAIERDPIATENRIRELTNNAASTWGLDRLFSSSDGVDLDGRAAIEGLLNKTFGTKLKPKYQFQGSEDFVEDFDFWNHIRFSPLGGHD